MAANYINDVESFPKKKRENHDYNNSVLGNLKNIRVNQELFDFSLNTDGELIYVHKLAFAVASDYFTTMFATDMKEGEEATVKLQNLDAISENAPVNYVYSGINAPTENNVEEVLCLSSILRSYE